LTTARYKASAGVVNPFTGLLFNLTNYKLVSRKQLAIAAHLIQFPTANTRKRNRPFKNCFSAEITNYAITNYQAITLYGPIATVMASHTQRVVNALMKV
jgi:hypothetical protein